MECRRLDGLELELATNLGPKHLEVVPELTKQLSIEEIIGERDGETLRPDHLSK